MFWLRYGGLNASKSTRSLYMHGRLPYPKIKELFQNPESGKPLRYGLKGERTVRINPYRIICGIGDSSLILLGFEHIDEVYD